MILPIFSRCDEDQFMTHFPWIPCLWSNAQYAIVMSLYNPEYHWFEVFYMLHRVLLSCILVLISDKLIQTAAIIVLLLLSYFVVSKKRPLFGTLENELDNIASGVLLFTVLLVVEGAGNVHGYVVFLLVCISLVALMIYVYSVFNPQNPLWSKFRKGYKRV